MLLCLLLAGAYTDEQRKDGACDTGPSTWNFYPHKSKRLACMYPKTLDFR